MRKDKAEMSTMMMVAVGAAAVAASVILFMFLFAPNPGPCKTDGWWDFQGYGPLTETQIYPAARDVALADAQEAAVEAVSGFELTGHVLVKNYILKDKTVEKKVHAFVKGLLPVKEYTKKIGDQEYVVVVVRVCKDNIEKVLGQTIINPLPTNGVANSNNGAKAATK